MSKIKCFIISWTGLVDELVGICIIEVTCNGNEQAYFSIPNWKHRMFSYLYRQTLYFILAANAYKKIVACLHFTNYDAPVVAISTPNTISWPLYDEYQIKGIQRK